MMNDYVGLLKKMSEITIGHTENVTRVTEGLANGGVAITTDKEGNQGIFTPVSRKGSLKSLEIFRRMAEKNGMKVEVAIPAWNKEVEDDTTNRNIVDDGVTLEDDSKTSTNDEIDPSKIGDLDIEVDKDGKTAKVKGHGVDRVIPVEGINAYHEGLLDACAMLGIDIPKLLNGEGEPVTKEEVNEFLKTKKGKKLVADIVAKLTGDIGGEKVAKPSKETNPKSENKNRENKKTPYQFKEPDEKSLELLDRHVKNLDAAISGDEFDEKRRNYIKNVIISEIDWSYKRGDKFLPKEDDFVKFEVENISKNNVIYLKRPDIRMVILPFRWNRKVYRIFKRTNDEAKDVAEINTWIEGKIHEEEARNQKVTKEAEKKATAENVTA